MKEVEIEQYGLHIKVFTLEKDFLKYIKKVYPESLETYKEVISNSLAFASKECVNGHDMLLYIPNEYNEELIDHELIHITWFIAEIIGMPLNYETQEFQAYLFIDIKRKVKKVYERGRKIPAKKCSN